MYIFGNSGGGVLGITPISEDAFVWLYVANSEKAEISSTTAATSSFENTSSTSSENFQWTPLGLLVLSWDVTVDASSGILESARGVGHVMGVTYGYDAAGNLLSAGTAAYTWNYRNRLTDTNINSTTTHYLYDYNDQRVQQDVKIGAGATSTTKYFSKLFETKGATTTLYVFLPNGELLATVEGNGAATSTYIAHTDHQGSTNVMSDKNGALAQLATYYPFGAKRNNELPSNGFRESRLFISQYDDVATNLNYLNARYYDATRGQFLSEDPMMQKIGLDLKEIERILLDPQMQNYYSYAKNNPINLSDPSGEITVAQQIQTLTLQVQLLTAIVNLYQQGATTQANTAYSRYQGIVGSSGYQSTMGSINTTGDKVETYSQGSGVTNKIFNQATTNNNASNVVGNSSIPSIVGRTAVIGGVRACLTSVACVIGVGVIGTYEAYTSSNAILERGSGGGSSYGKDLPYEPGAYKEVSLPPSVDLGDPAPLPENPKTPEWMKWAYRATVGAAAVQSFLEIFGL